MIGQGCQICWGHCAFHFLNYLRGRDCKVQYKPDVNKLEQRQYKNDSTEFRCMLILNLPTCFPHRIAEWKSAPNSKQTFIWSPSIRSYIILALIELIRPLLLLSANPNIYLAFNAGHLGDTKKKSRMVQRIFRKVIISNALIRSAERELWWARLRSMKILIFIIKIKFQPKIKRCREPKLGIFTKIAYHLYLILLLCHLFV